MTRSRGFTLIEVLIALLVFGLIASTAGKLGSQYILTYERVRDKTFAAWVADNRINEIRLQEEAPGISENSRDLTFGTSRWQVTTAILGTQDDSIRRVEVTVGKYRGNEAEPSPTHTLSAFLGVSR